MTDSPRDLGPEEAHRSHFSAVFDIRPHASSTRTLPGAILVSAESLVDRPSDFIATSSDALLIVCDIGRRSAVVTDQLRSAGYGGAVSLDGGIEAWALAGLATEAPEGLTRDEYVRYDRQLKLPDFGMSGQQSLRDARVAVVGVGGLGAPVLAYLAGAGVGHLTIIDSDRVEVSNLHRQPIYTMSDVGRPKTEAASHYVAALNPTVEVTMVAVHIDDTNATDLLVGNDVVVLCTDSFETAHAVNKAAVDLGVPMVFGSVYRSEGQFAVFDATTGPCYACVFPQDRGGSALDCSIVGVLGPVTGIVGAIQAAETIKLVTGVGQPVSGSLRLYDAQNQTFDSLVVRKNPACAACGSDD